MSHARQQIREQVSRLLELTPDLAGRIYINPRAHFGDEQLPAVVVQVPSETIEEMGTRKEHVLLVSVEVITMSDVPADDLDTLCAVLERALASDSLDDFVADWRHVSTVLTFDSMRRQVAGSAKLTFACLYHSAIADPETII